jgi:hypothetical protein
MHRLLLIIMLVLCSQGIFAQHIMAPLNPEQTALVDAHLAKSNQVKPTGFAPYLMSMQTLDSIYDADTKRWQRR